MSKVRTTALAAVVSTAMLSGCGMPGADLVTWWSLADRAVQDDPGPQAAPAPAATPAPSGTGAPVDPVTPTTSPTSPATTTPATPPTTTTTTPTPAPPRTTPPPARTRETSKPFTPQVKASRARIVSAWNQVMPDTTSSILGSRFSVLEVDGRLYGHLSLVFIGHDIYTTNEETTADIDGALRRNGWKRIGRGSTQMLAKGPLRIRKQCSEGVCTFLTLDTTALPKNTPRPAFVIGLEDLDHNPAPK